MRTSIRILLLIAALTAGRSAMAGIGRYPLRTHHRVFVSWGYNRAQYTASRIHFKGDDYDFTLHDVTASDRPEGFSLGNYFTPTTIWIPQYNYRAGWFYSDYWSISIGLDHMKYVVDQGQDVQITGVIDPQRSQQYAGNETHMVTITKDFLQYEHTDGLNLLSIDVDHYDGIWANKKGNFTVALTEGLFIGPMIPRTDVRLFGEGINNRFHLAGYGAGMQLGLFAMFHERLFARVLVKGGYTDMPDVLTTGTSSDRASQGFWFLQENFSLGVLIGKKNG